MAYTTSRTRLGIISLLLSTPLLGLSQPISAQEQPRIGVAGAFTSENAILDTSIPFAIGAQEAQQSLRGSFGWPTFQEGLVEGVYFRFDPDGYARFSASPRLDSDVFEVICRPRTYTCIARKGSMQIMLSNRGQTQIKLDTVLEGDQFFVTDGLSEIQMPERILMPLDVQMETLLAVGGDILIRRNGEEVDRVSLTGFGAVASYLRWIAARQDYSVLPRGWPVPNSQASQNSGGITQASTWQSPMPQPQQIPPTPAQVPGGVTMVLPDTAPAIAGMRSELSELRQMLGGTNIEPQNAPVLPALNAPVSRDLTKDERIAALEEMTAQLQAQLDALSKANPTLMHLEADPPQPELSADPTTPASTPPVDENDLGHLKYLVEDMGLDLQTAIDLLQLRSAASTSIKPAALKTAPHDDLVDEILQDLSSQVTEEALAPSDAESSETLPATNETEYKLLTDYFQSAMETSKN